MAFKAKGPRAKTRYKLQKKVKGRPKVNDMLKKFAVGDRVIIKIEPSVHEGMPFHRFHGKHGVVVKQRGDSYLVEVKDGGKLKQVIAHPVHLRRAM